MLILAVRMLLADCGRHILERDQCCHSVDRSVSPIGRQFQRSKIQNRHGNFTQLRNDALLHRKARV